jgi:ABC-2 type transport system ATP-binding protein
VIKVKNLTKYYGKRLAVDNISFEVKKGEIVGFLGPNAAGKTTTMRMLTGFLAPTDGRAWIADYDSLLIPSKPASISAISPNPFRSTRI